MKNIFSTILIIFFVSIFAKNSFSQIDHWEKVVEASDNWKYFLGTQEPPTDWSDIQFNDSFWLEGAGGFGYGDGDDSTEIQPVNSIYLRKTFNLSDTSFIEGALFYIDYDDAFVAYLNGKEIARGNIGVFGQIPSYNTYADNNIHEAQMYQGGIPEYFAIPPSSLDTIMLAGNNVLAIQIHNYGTSSSDLSAIPFLFVATSDTNSNASLLPEWFDSNHFAFSSHLPIISINTNNQQIIDDYRIVADMKTFENSDGLFNSTLDQANTECKINIEIRGSSTQMFDKKSYAFETQLENGENLNIPLLGMPEENDWILYAPYTDKSLLRNVLVYELAREMGWYAVRCVYCELFIDSEYRGIYVLMEKIKRDKKRLSIDKVDNDDNSGDSLTGGYIYKVDWADETGTYDWPSPISSFNGNSLNLQYQYEYPDRDDITAEQSVYIQQYVSSFEYSLAGSNFTDIQYGYRNYIDIHSFVDYFIIQELTFNVDAYRLSNFYTKVRDSKGGKIFAGPVWDFNLGFGNADYGSGWMTSGWALENPYVIDVIPFHLKRLQEDNDFQDLLRCRWDELRNSILSEANIYEKIDSLTGYLGEAIDRNFEKWNILGNYVWPNYFVGNTHDEEINYLKNYISERTIWIDNNLYGSGVYCNSFYLSKIVISEINFENTNPDYASGDWFELYNKSSTSIDMSGWTIKDENKLNSFTIPIGTVLASQNYLVICCNAEEFSSFYPSVNNFVGSFNWKLGSNDCINLYDSDGFLIDIVDYEQTNNWPNLNNLGATLELDNINIGNNLPQNWFVGCPGGSPGKAYSLPCEHDILAVQDSQQTFSIVFDSGEDKLYILSPIAEKFTYEISSLDGKIVQYGIISDSDQSIKLTKIQNSVYAIRIVSSTRSMTKLFVKY